MPLLGGGQLGPGQLGPGQLGPGQLGPGARLSGAQFATFSGRTVGPRTTRPRGPTVRGLICHGQLGPGQPGPNCPGPDCPGPNLPRTCRTYLKSVCCSKTLVILIDNHQRMGILNQFEAEMNIILFRHLLWVEVWMELVPGTFSTLYSHFFLGQLPGLPWPPSQDHYSLLEHRLWVEGCG